MLPCATAAVPGSRVGVVRSRAGTGKPGRVSQNRASRNFLDIACIYIYTHAHIHMYIYNMYAYIYMHIHLERERERVELRFLSGYNIWSRRQLIAFNKSLGSPQILRRQAPGSPARKAPREEPQAQPAQPPRRGRSLPSSNGFGGLVGGGNGGLDMSFRIVTCGFGSSAGACPCGRQMPAAAPEHEGGWKRQGSGGRTERHVLCMCLTCVHVLFIHLFICIIVCANGYSGRIRKYLFRRG